MIRLVAALALITIMATVFFADAAPNKSRAKP